MWSLLLFGNNTILDKSIEKLAHGHVFDIRVKLSTTDSTTSFKVEICVISFDKDRVYEDHLHVIWIWSLCIIQKQKRTLKSQAFASRKHKCRWDVVCNEGRRPLIFLRTWSSVTKVFSSFFSIFPSQSSTRSFMEHTFPCGLRYNVLLSVRGSSIVLIVNAAASTSLTNTATKQKKTKHRKIET